MRAISIAVLLLAGCAAHAPPPAAPQTSSAEFYERGITAAQRGDSVRGEQYLALALAGGYRPEHTFQQLIILCLDAERYEAALLHARARLLDAPDDWRLRYLIATLHLALEQYRRAEEQLSILIQERPSVAAPYYLLALAARDGEGDAKRTKRYFRAYLRREPEGERAKEARRYLARQRADERDERRQP